MARSLVIVESPAKAKTIGKFLGRSFAVKASVGHIKDLPKSKLAVDIENGFKPQYVVIPSKAKIVKELREAAKSSAAIYLAADPDREGEAICQHLAEELGKTSHAIHRVLFHEITRKAIEEAFRRPRAIDANKVAAQQARRVLDRLVGYKVSPLLWDKVRRGLSAGRVQTVALRMIVDREKEIRAFKQEEYWNLTARLAAGEPPEFLARAHSLDGQKWKIADGATANAIAEELRRAEFVVRRIHRREKKRYPVPPFITSKLQQDAARRLNFSVKKTMTLAQRLYEGVDLGEEGAVGLITYMRTDSTRIAEEALHEVRGYIRDQFGAEYLPHHPVYYKSKKTAQDAHEAIRPTSVERTPEKLRPYLEPDLLKLYTLIWNRFVASQMNPALFDQTDVHIEAGRVEFRASGSVMKFDGFLRLYQEARPEESARDGEDEEAGPLPAMHEGEILELRELVPSQHFTQPPPRYTEAGLVKALEARGIGRPSTYATILSIIQNRQYVTKQAGRFHPTETGEIVVELLVASFREIFNYDYTARLEDRLDRIESGREVWTDTIRDFYARFSSELEAAERQMRDLKSEEIATDEVCEKCGSPMVIKWGRFGRFLACSAYPKCRNTREVSRPSQGPDASGAEEMPQATCDKCGRPMVVKRGRYGEFLACSGYPECRNTRKMASTPAGTETPAEVIADEHCPLCGKNLARRRGRYGVYVSCSDWPACRYLKVRSTGVACPKNCGGELVERRSRQGRIFYGCSNYPRCAYAVWHRPLPLPCPDCGLPFTLLKTTKRAGTTRYCSDKTCGFQEPFDAPLPVVPAPAGESA